MNYSTRNKNKVVKFIVIHYTGMSDLSSAYSKLSLLNSNVSCHYLISRLGKIYIIIPPDLKAWHAGVSEWKKYRNLNDYSIGVELENKGHDHGYQKFTTKQYKALDILTNSLSFFYHIKSCNIIAHSDISPNRKKDPGEKFSWPIFKKFNHNKSIQSYKNLDLMLKKYGFSSRYIAKYRIYCIKAVKRKLGYRHINANLTKQFMSDFNYLIN